MSKTANNIYFVPGLAANPDIFEYLVLPAGWQIHYLDWMLPESPGETLEHYVGRMSGRIKEKNPVLIGVSFGGVVVQEMKKHVQPEKVIIISSIKSRKELPYHLRLVRNTKAYKILPLSVISNIEKYEKYFFGHSLRKRAELYKKYLSMRDKQYLQWAIRRIVHWDREEADPGVIHIHGTDDGVFPADNITNFIPVKGGTHIMILTKAHTISKLLIEIIEKTEK